MVQPLSPSYNEELYLDSVRDLRLYVSGTCRAGENGLLYWQRRLPDFLGYSFPVVALFFPRHERVSGEIGAGDVADRGKTRFCTPARSDRTRPIIISFPRPFSRFPFLCVFDHDCAPPCLRLSPNLCFQLPASSLSTLCYLSSFLSSAFSFSFFFSFLSHAFQGSSFSSSRCLPVAF
jgi:hypothetical protein